MRSEDLFERSVGPLKVLLWIVQIAASSLVAISLYSDPHASDHELREKAAAVVSVLASSVLAVATSSGYDGRI